MKRSRLVVLPEPDESPSRTFDPVAAGFDEANLTPLEDPAGLRSSEADNGSKSPLRMLMVLMERPFFALGKRRVGQLEYVSPDGTIEIRVQPGVDGMATIYDADLIMFLVDRLALVPPRVSGTVIVKGAAYLRAVGSRTGGDQYALLGKAIGRLSTTRITTNAQPDGKPGLVRTFPWIERAVRQGNDWQITVSSWLAEGARSRFVLDICPEYFDLGGFDRFLYLTARKHVGRERGREFKIKITTLWGKSGSASKLAKFKHEVKSIATEDRLPEYQIEWKEGRSHDALLIFRRR